ncbi:MAG: TetR/AcrR family transcriptional regulator [Coleofasciculaceae cyanobacterium SM2_1_6]|nr:TetR/AcrR family transcriptional regulator [Coleofasciculaceae cyanobacterium SM2_1_6]
MSLAAKQTDGYELILDRAETLFREQGYNQVSMRDIATATGMRQASLYYHFASKEQLFIAVRENIFAQHRIGLEQSLAGAGQDLRSQLQGAATWFLSQPPIKFLSMLQSDMPALSPEAQQHLFEVATQNVFNPIQQIFLAAQVDEQIRPVCPDLLAGFFLSLVESIHQFQNIQTKCQDTSGAAMAEQMISVLLQGVQNEVSSATSLGGLESIKANVITTS